MLDIVIQILQTESISERDRFCFVHQMLSDFLPRRKGDRKVSAETEQALIRFLIANGYCGDCQIRAVSKKNDTSCAVCKKKMRDSFKKQSEKNFRKL